MKFRQRLILNTTDISTKLGNFRSGAVAFAYTSGQYLYIGAEKPFNNLWFDVGTANDVAATISIQIWDANQWRDAIDIADETMNAAGTIPLAQDGRISWNTAVDRGWSIESESKRVTGLENTKLFDLYWLRMSWSDTLKPETTLVYIGQKFSEDENLFDFYPDLNNADLREAFEANKQNWDRQHYIATEKVIDELIEKRLIVDRGQILDWEMFREANCHMVAQLIYKGLGAQTFATEISTARGDYKISMSKDKFRLDKNGTGRLESTERKKSQLYGRR